MHQQIANRESDPLHGRPSVLVGSFVGEPLQGHRHAMELERNPSIVSLPGPLKEAGRPADALVHRSNGDVRTPRPRKSC